MYECSNGTECKGIGRVQEAPVQKVDKRKAAVLTRLAIIGDIDPRHRPESGEEVLEVGGRHRHSNAQRELSL